MEQINENYFFLSKFAHSLKKNLSRAIVSDKSGEPKKKPRAGDVALALGL